MAKALMRKDLTGQKFNKLTPIKVDEERSKNGKVYWICQCECGKLTSVQSTSLTRSKNSIKSCGCARNSKEAQQKAKEKSESYPKDITGLKFGKLEVVRQTNIKSNRKSDNGAKLWECKCDCGNTCFYSRYSLIGASSVRSCGCLYFETRGIAAKHYCEYDLDTYDDFGVGYCNNNTFFFFDKEDYDKIKDYSWWYDGRYVCAHSLPNDKYTTQIVRLHRVVMDIDDRENINVDHINLVRYDCRKSNLRRATDRENSYNKIYNPSGTNVVGVIKEKDKYSSYISIDGKYTKLGSFNTLEQATFVRKSAEKLYYKEFAFNANADKIDEKYILNKLNNIA